MTVIDSPAVTWCVLLDSVPQVRWLSSTGPTVTWCFVWHCDTGKITVIDRPSCHMMFCLTLCHRSNNCHRLAQLSRISMQSRINTIFIQDTYSFLPSVRIWRRSTSIAGRQGYAIPTNSSVGIVGETTHIIREYSLYCLAKYSTLRNKWRPGSESDSWEAFTNEAFHARLPLYWLIFDMKYL